MRRQTFLALVFIVSVSFLTSSVPLLAEEKNPKSLEDLRQETIKYGTDVELLALTKALDAEKAEYLDADLAALAETTHNGKILSALFSLFGSRKNPLIIDTALRIIEERDTESKDAVEAAIDYLGRVASKNDSSSLRKGSALREVLDAEESRFMAPAVRALGRSGTDDADGNAKYLIDYYQERNAPEAILQEIIGALGELKSPVSVPFLSDIIKDTEEKAVRRMAALDAIEKIGDDTGLDAVLTALASSDPNVRASAVAALGPFSQAQAEEALLEAFRDSYYKSRAGAALAAGKRRLEAAVPFLQYRALRDEVPAVRDEAIRALGSIDSSASIKVLRSLFEDTKQSDRSRITAALALLDKDASHSAPKIVLALEEAKDKKRKDLASGLLKALADAKDSSLESLAARLLASSDIVDRMYGLQIAEQNQFSSLSEAIRPLSTEKNETIARKAKDALKALGAEETVEAETSVSSEPSSQEP